MQTCHSNMNEFPPPKIYGFSPFICCRCRAVMLHNFSNKPHLFIDVTYKCWYHRYSCFIHPAYILFLNTKSLGHLLFSLLILYKYKYIDFFFFFWKLSLLLCSSLLYGSWNTCRSLITVQIYWSFFWRCKFLGVTLVFFYNSSDIDMMKIFFRILLV